MNATEKVKSIANPPDPDSRTSEAKETVMNYKQARKDFEFLESIAELSDQQALDERRQDLMQNPTKQFAAGMYEYGIELWFEEHGVTPETEKIAKRYGVTA